MDDLDPLETGPAGTRLWIELQKIAQPVTDDRLGRAVKIGQHDVADLAFGVVKIFGLDQDDVDGTVRVLRASASSAR